MRCTCGREHSAPDCATPPEAPSDRAPGTSTSRRGPLPTRRASRLDGLGWGLRRTHLQRASTRTGSYRHGCHAAPYMADLPAHHAISTSLPLFSSTAEARPEILARSTRQPPSGSTATPSGALHCTCTCHCHCSCHCSCHCAQAAERRPPAIHGTVHCFIHERSGVRPTACASAPSPPPPGGPPAAAATS